MKVTSPRIETWREAAAYVSAWAKRHPEGSPMRLELEMVAARLITRAESESERPDPFNPDTPSQGKN